MRRLAWSLLFTLCPKAHFLTTRPICNAVQLADLLPVSMLTPKSSVRPMWTQIRRRITRITISVSRIVRKWTFGHMQTAKRLASIRIRTGSPEAFLFALSCIKIYCLWKQIAKLLVRLHGCAGSPKALVFAYEEHPSSIYIGFININDCGINFRV